MARSYLYVPGDRPDRLASAGGRGADALILDLEDAVAPARKAAARDTVRDWLAGQQPGGRLWVRVNPDALEADLDAALAPAVAGIVLPKAEPELLRDAHAVMSARERALGLDAGRFRLLPLIETARGLLAVAQVAAADRVARLGLGEADLAAELGLQPGPDRAELLPLRLQVVVASAAAGIAPPSGPAATDFRDLAGLRESTSALRRLGFRARTAIHPAQVPVINGVFTASDAELAEARRVVELFEAGQRRGEGAVADQRGGMVDLAVVRAARALLASAD